MEKTKKRLNPKKVKSARRKRNPKYWKSEDRRIIPEMPVCKECVKEEKKSRLQLQKEKPAPFGKVYIKNPHVRCKDCKK